MVRIHSPRPVSKGSPSANTSKGFLFVTQRLTSVHVRFELPGHLYMQCVVRPDRPQAGVSPLRQANDEVGEGVCRQEDHQKQARTRCWTSIHKSSGTWPMTSETTPLLNVKSRPHRTVVLSVNPVSRKSGCFEEISTS